MTHTSVHPNCRGTRPNRAGGRGPSSFWMQAPDLVFDDLAISPGERILDLGCGAGEYTLEAARQAGPSSIVTALDHWPPIVEAMKQSARDEGLTWIRTIRADITRPPLPVDSGSVDLCLLFTVLHIFDVECHSRPLFREISRVLAPGGTLAVLECKKEDMPFGPPMHMRLSPGQVEAIATDTGFRKTGRVDLAYNYLLRFVHQP